jgi:hypothetical protein
VGLSEVLNRLQFDDHLIFDQKIEPVTAYRLSVVSDLDISFGREAQTLLPQFNCQSSLIDLFNETGTKVTVHRDNRFDDGVSQRILDAGIFLPLISPHLHIPISKSALLRPVECVAGTQQTRRQREAVKHHERAAGQRRAVEPAEVDVEAG